MKSKTKEIGFIFTTDEYKEVFNSVEEAQPFADKIGGEVVEVYLQEAVASYLTKEDGVFIGYEVKNGHGDYFDAEDCLYEFGDLNGGDNSTNNNNNNGEDSMEQKNDEVYVTFKIENKEDSRIYLAGSVEFGLEDDDVEWEYEQNDGTYSQHFPNYWKVDGEDLSFEFEQFTSSIDWDVVEQDLWGCRDENRTFDYGKYIIIINDGAKMECIIKETAERGDFVVEVIPIFNGEKIDLTSYMTDNWEIFDPYDVNLPTSCIEDGHIFFEIDKEYFEADESGKEKIMEEVNKEAQRIFARHLTRELGIYTKYGDIMEQAFDDTWDNEWLFKLSQIENSDELEEFMDREGFEY